MVKELINKLTDTKITLKNLNKKTAQEVFDYIANHLLTQNAQSKDPNNGACLYRGPDGKKCAVGILFEDSDYDRNYEGTNWIGLCVDDAFPQRHKILIHKLQEIHDNMPANHWRFYLKCLAREYALNFVDIDGSVMSIGYNKI